MAVSANCLHSPSRLCHREGAFTQFTFQNGQESRKWLTIQICHVLNAWEAKKPLYGTKNLSKGAKTRVRVLADIQNFALRAHCVRTACMAFPCYPKQTVSYRSSPLLINSTGVHEDANLQKCIVEDLVPFLCGLLSNNNAMDGLMVAATPVIAIHPTIFVLVLCMC